VTWVVAGNSAFFPLMVGDVRVTFTTREGQRFEHDCLQKIYPLAPNLVAGFAGSVRAGMFMLEALRLQLDQKQLHSLPQMAHTWLPRELRRMFRKLGTDDRSAGCQLMFISAHPELDQGAPEWPRPHTCRLVAPDFEPEMSTGRAFLSIGSGQNVEAYRAAAEKVVEGFQLEMSVTGGWHLPAQSLADYLHWTVNRSPTAGVSSHFVYATVFREGFIIAPHSYTVHEGDGRKRFVGPPPLARSYAEFVAYCRANGIGATAVAECR
jgi:hypothetical protein